MLPTTTQQQLQLIQQLLQDNQLAAAESACRVLLAADPNCSPAWFALGLIALSTNQLADAESAFRRAVIADANNSDAWLNLGSALHNLSNFAAAQDAYERSLTLTPENEFALKNYTLLLAHRGTPQRACQFLPPLLRRVPRLAPMWSALGNAWLSAGNFPQAEAAYRRAREIDPKNRETQYNLALVLEQQWSLPQAEAVAREILAQNPNDAEAWSRLGGIQYAQGDIDDALASLRRAIALEPIQNRHSRLLQCLHYSEKVSPTEILTAHREWDSLYAQPILQRASTFDIRHSTFDTPTPTQSANKVRHLRLGFLSANFGTNPTAFLVLPALQALDKSKCTVVCYSDRAAPDEYTEKFRLASQLWRPTCLMPDEQLASQIKNDEIDILVDLMGHSGKRLLVFARRPAPLQITWLGYVGTTGLAAMDCLLADQHHVRPGEEANHREKILRLPHDCICYAPPANAPEVAPLPALTTGHITFGCFNNPAKFSPSTLDAWAQILRRVPTSHLLLKFGGLHHPEVQAAIRKKFDARQVDQTRLHFEGWSPHRDLLAAYNRIDIALDTQPYSGGVTTCEALWMGVPVITFPGPTFASRHSTSHLTNASCPDLLATDWPTYINLAEDWSTRLPDLSTFRSSLRPRMQASTLCNAPQFAANLLSLWQHEFAARAV